MDDVDRSILQEIQSGFPMDVRPYRVLAERLGLVEDEVIGRVARLRRDGIIRRIGGNFASRTLGHTSTLCAARVPDDKIDEFVAAVNRHSGVTHNYRRRHEYNIWFTIIAPSQDHIQAIIDDVARATGVSDICNLPARQIFKIKVDFPV